MIGNPSISSSLTKYAWSQIVYFGLEITHKLLVLLQLKIDFKIGIIPPCLTDIVIAKHKIHRYYNLKY